MLAHRGSKLVNAIIGDGLALPKDHQVTRFYFQNVNGINVSRYSTWELTCSHIKDMEVDFAMVAEHKLDTTQPWVMKRLHHGARKIFGQGSYTLTASSTPIPAPTQHKPGGILSMAIGSLRGRVLTSGADPLGRWVGSGGQDASS